MKQTKHTSIISANGDQLTDVLAVPLYYKSYVIGAGPDGKGYDSFRYVVTKPFLFHSGDDLMKSCLKSKHIVTMFPPYIFVGRGNYVVTWLFIKNGYSPKMVKNKEIKEEVPIVMIKSKDESSTLIDMLLTIKSNHNQSILKKQFGAESLKENIDVAFNENDTAILRKAK